jgi:hypothetical protein
MEDYFDIYFEAGGKKYAGTVYTDHLGEKLLFQLHYHAQEDGKPAIVFIELGDETSNVPGPVWVQRIAEGEQPFLSSEFLQAAGDGIEKHGL